MTKKFIVNEEIDYDEISKNDIYKLSLASSLTESLIQSKIEKDFYAYHKNNDSFDLKKFLTKQIQNSKLNKNDIIKDGKIRFIIQNSVLKKKVSNAFNENNIIIDFTFNKDLLVVNVLDVIDILELDNNKNNELLQNSIKAYLPTEKNKNLANEISEKLPEQNSSIKETVINLIKYLGKSAYEKFLDLAFSKIIFGQN